MFSLDRVKGRGEIGAKPSARSTQEGEDLGIYCNYSSTASDRLHDPDSIWGETWNLFSLMWDGTVKQRDGQRPYLIAKPKASGGTLHITAFQMAFLPPTAMDAQCPTDAFSLYPNLHLQLGPHPCWGCSLWSLVHCLCISSCKEKYEMNEQSF